MTKLSIKERYEMGREFQDYVANLLSLSGYLEGQIYSTGVSRISMHYKKLKRLKRYAYTSPDIMIANRWMDDSPIVEFRFGLACSRRDKFFDNYGIKSVTVPTYQRKHYEIMKKLKHLEVYLTFGHKLDENYAIGITELREPDDVRRLVDHSTGTPRWNDIYYLKKLLSWNSFIEHRIKEGDKEPMLENLENINIPWIGDF